MKCGLAPFTAIVQSITIERRFRRNEYRFHNLLKRKFFRKMIFQSIYTNRCNIQQTKTRQEKPETETEMETETYKTPCMLTHSCNDGYKRRSIFETERCFTVIVFINKQVLTWQSMLKPRWRKHSLQYHTTLKVWKIVTHCAVVEEFAGNDIMFLNDPNHKRGNSIITCW